MKKMCKKIKYTTEEPARIVLAKMVLSSYKLTVNDLRIYKCWPCKAFHLTKQKRRTF